MQCQQKGIRAGLCLHGCGTLVPSLLGLGTSPDCFLALGFFVPLPERGQKLKLRLPQHRLRALGHWLLSLSVIPDIGCVILGLSLPLSGL